MISNIFAIIFLLIAVFSLVEMTSNRIKMAKHGFHTRFETVDVVMTTICFIVSYGLWVW